MRAILLVTLVVLGSTSCEETELGQVRAAVVINAGDYPSIQAAVDAAASGDTVQVPPGTHDEFIVQLKPGVTLEGAGPDRTVLHGQIHFAGGEPGVVIRGFRINCAGFTVVQVGAILIESGGAIVEGNVVESNRLIGINFDYGATGECSTVPASDQSLTRSPDITGGFVPHTEAAGAAGAAFSPGTLIDGTSF
jgi:hypothetical protein